MQARRNLDRVSRSVGSQPVIFKDATTDALAGMVLALLGEVSVLRDRLDANERLLAARGLHGPADVDDYRPAVDAKTYRTAYRNRMYDRVLGVGRDKLLPAALKEQHAYDGVLSDVTTD